MNSFAPYQSFIMYSRYSRWLDKEQRRESWEEVIGRYLNYVNKHLKDKHSYEISTKEYKELFQAIQNLEVVPSMRAMMMAGPALERDQIGSYNCSYLPVDNPRSFDECMYILMSGTGVGFSVERQYISQLPTINEHFEDSSTVIIPRDTRAGWAESLRELLSLLYSGRIPSWDLSRLRPAGARLKTTGGRSSGPEPLNELFRFCVTLFKKASGRKLTSLECHDLMCKIGEVVVVGGVRRSALISLSNLSDERMRDAKQGQWWQENSQRALSNNSVCYTERPDTAVFMKEWLSLYQSRSGERGIFNREAATKQVKKIGRRDPEHEWGCNPCQPGFASVLTPNGVATFDDIVVGSTIWSGKRWTRVSNKVFTGIKEVKAYITNNGVFIGTEDHRVVQRGIKVKVKEATHIDVSNYPVPVSINPSFNLESSSCGTSKIVGTFTLGSYPVHDITVEAEEHTYWTGGLLVSNCSEIILRPYQFCNLSESVVRAEDTLQDIKRKVRLATILGTYQSTMTNFKYLRSIWRKNTEEERLLGVSLTGIMDNVNLVHNTEWMEEIKEEAVKVNKELSKKLSINQSTAITCVKPSGTVSQLVDSASGIHPRWSQYYIRTVRCDNKDPITNLLKDQGIPNEPDIMNPNHVTVFSFPQKAPEGALTREDVPAINHLTIWKRFQDFYCEHKPSITVNIKENEWLDVQAWVWRNFDQVSGIAFLPYDEHSYKQAPYQEITKEQYDEIMRSFPKEIDWSRLPEYEKEDETQSSQDLACVGGVCEIVDLVK